MSEKISLSKLAVFIMFYSTLIASISQFPWYQPPEIMVVSTSELGRIIFDLQGYVAPFEILSLVLLAAIIGAVFIAKEESK